MKRFWIGVVIVVVLGGGYWWHAAHRQATLTSRGEWRARFLATMERVKVAESQRKEKDKERR